MEVNDTDNVNMTAIVDQEEILAAFRSSPRGKCPGPDGLTREFYIRCWQVIREELTAIFNEMMRGQIRKELLDGIVILVRKKMNDGTIKAYRPISLLNVDYKTFSRILKNRTLKIIPKVLTNVQKCSNASQKITDALTSTRDKICEAKYRKRSGILVSFDFDHAFDRVEPHFLIAILERMGFNPQFIDIIRKISSLGHSRLLINGKISRELKIGRSVRQGDPLSMLLFIIYIEPLLQKLTNALDPSIDLINGYADDISMVVSSPQKCDIVRQIMQRFCRVSGAKLNLSKTVGLKINGEIASPEWLVMKERITILGVQFESDLSSMAEYNWNQRLRAFCNTLYVHKLRSLNIYQKSIFVNTYASSKLWYLASVIMCPNKICGKITSHITKFMRHGLTHCLAMNQMTLPKSMGGLGLHSVIFKTKSLFMSIFQRQLQDPTSFISIFRDNRCLSQLPARCLYIKKIFKNRDNFLRK